MDKQYSLIIFDYNGTLVNTPWVDKQPLHILPGRIAKMAFLRLHAVKLAVATNQAGPLWYIATGKPQFPYVSQVVNELSKMKRELAMEHDLWLISLYDSRAMALLKSQYEQQRLIAPEDVLKDLQKETEKGFNSALMRAGAEKAWRKPEPGMLLETMRHYGMEPRETLYVGDLLDDNYAAESAGVDFAWAHMFFGK
jgi:HAD superfamily hydrolase (TIGR01662 family)